MNNRIRRRVLSRTKYKNAIRNKSALFGYNQTKNYNNKPIVNLQDKLLHSYCNCSYY